MTNLEKMLETSFTQAWTVLISADVEVQAHQKAIAIFLLEHPEWAEDLNAYVASQRQEPDLLAEMRKKYARLLETFFQTILDPSLEEIQVLDRLRKLEELPR
jgi:hypothetical protein